MVKILLSRGHESFVDDDLLDKVAHIRWFSEIREHIIYARASVGGKNIYMHHLILSPKIGYEIDHKNGNGLDNRIENLRYATHTQNCQNSRKNKTHPSSKFKGVCWDKSRGKWIAQIQTNGIPRNLGRYDFEVLAAEVYDREAIRSFGEFAFLNFPEDLGEIVGDQKGTT